MTDLVTPDLRLHESWAEAVAEFDAAGSVQHGAGLWRMAQPLDVTEEGCRAVIDYLRAQADPDTQLEDGLVPCSYYWITDGAGDQEDDDGEFVGYLALRHELNDWLLEEGGHIGYSVRPSRRREGHASRALALAVRRAAELGLDRVLLTCDEDNDGSRRTIERNGGVYEDTRKGKRRYWIDTAASGR